LDFLFRRKLAPDFLATILRLPFRRLVVANVLFEILGLVGSLLN